MTEQEAIEAINGFRRICYTNDITGMEKARKDEEAIDMAISALEKQIPKKPIKIRYRLYVCECGRNLSPTFIDDDATLQMFFNFCPECGQKVNWEGDTE